MPETLKWRDGVSVVRTESLDKAMSGPSGTERATAFDFFGTGGRETWVGRVTLQPLAKTGAHHHGRHEIATYVVKGRSQIRWGERLEFAAEVDGAEVDECVFWGPDSLPRPISDFTLLRIRDGMVGSTYPMPTLVGSRRSLD
jgi:uncharacterized RmlC-like cupin family protein